VRGDGPTLLPACVRGVSDDQRYVVLLAVRDCTLGVKLMRAVHVTMIIKIFRIPNALQCRS
jgi:hypothetical protein